MKLVNMPTLEDLNLKVAVFTHNDLDGVGCGIVAECFFPKHQKENAPEEAPYVVHCGYKDIEERLINFISSGEEYHYDRVYITDISVSKSLADKITEINKDYGFNKFQLIDHHKTALWLNDYPWAKVVTNNIDGGIESGTSLFLEHLYGEFEYKLLPYHAYQDALHYFAELVRKYDSWEWKNVYFDDEPSKLNDLMWLVGFGKFREDMIAKLNKSTQRFKSGVWMGLFNETDQILLDIDANSKKHYIKNKAKHMKVVDFHNKKIGVVFAERYISEVGNDLAEMFIDKIDIVLIIDPTARRLSFRSVKTDLHLGEFSRKFFNGGGHANASGATYVTQYNEDLINSILFPKQSIWSKLASLFKKKG